MRKKVIKKAGRHFSVEDQHKIIQEMISNGCTKQAIWKKYTGQDEKKGQLFRWMKKLGYSSYRPRKEANLKESNSPIPRNNNSKPTPDETAQNNDILQMQRRLLITY
ncbi:hypothetical protein SYJ56_25735 [Algoriphagus sp. D3-2-R+10]|uniref:hypothetical protein n=1 Tax=Algoriphagus aurantiacus TaxID=3103948 RepID=UPI002B3950DB|nr:hypothetical protein [Algoriphagus sp. D3-2-R+10]MEB2778736.1 hypothetical protein [Algoriphagus sp. D3-2-R+10]